MKKYALSFLKAYKKCLAGVVGIEPTSKVLETPILPLNHTPIGKAFAFPVRKTLRKRRNEQKFGRFDIRPTIRIHTAISRQCILITHEGWCANRDSNPGPTGYEPVALTN